MEVHFHRYGNKSNRRRKVLQTLSLICFFCLLLVIISLSFSRAIKFNQDINNYQYQYFPSKPNQQIRQMRKYLSPGTSINKLKIDLTSLYGRNFNKKRRRIHFSYLNNLICSTKMRDLYMPCLYVKTTNTCFDNRRRSIFSKSNLVLNIGSKTVGSEEAAAFEADGKSDLNDKFVFKTLAESSIYEEVIKKSTFIAHAKPVSDWKEANSFLNSIRSRKDYSKARRFCWAYRSSRGEERSSDDGEPTGTAAPPILNALQSQNLSDVIIVVVRFFGGVKLGAGGLIRAYGHAARGSLQDNSNHLLKHKLVDMKIKVKQDIIGSLYRLLTSYSRYEQDFYEGLFVTLYVSVPLEEKATVIQSIIDISKGSAIITEREE